MGAVVRPDVDTPPVITRVQQPGIVIDRILAAGEDPPPGTPPGTVFLVDEEA